MPAAETRLIFDVPNGRLVFQPGSLDAWAEHLVWCYELMGVKRGATIAVQDFGGSPLSFLGSALLMPGLVRGVAERLGGRFIGLDASAERVTLTPAVLEQIPVDVLVVRADVAALLAAEIRHKGRSGTGKPPARTVVAFNDEDAVPMRGSGAPWRYLLHVPSSMLMAPQCGTCGYFHLRAGVYRLDGAQVSNLGYQGAPSWRLPQSWTRTPKGCALGLDDSTISPAAWTQAVEQG